MVEEIVKNTRNYGYIEIDAPVDFVWKMVTQFEDFTVDSKIHKVEFLTPDIRGVGQKTRWHFDLTTEDPKGVPTIQEEEIIEWHPPDEDNTAYYTFKPLDGKMERFATYLISPTAKGTFVALVKYFPAGNPRLRGVGGTTTRQLRELKEVCEKEWKEQK